MLALSNFREFHGLLLDNQIGDATMKIVDYQIKRGAMITDELKGKLGQRTTLFNRYDSLQAGGGKVDGAHGTEGDRDRGQEVSRDDQKARQAVLPY